MAAGVVDRLWSPEELVDRISRWEGAMKWEYHVETLKLEGRGELAQDILNEYGNEGWEAIGFVSNSVGKDQSYTAVIFKRPAKTSN